MQIHDFPAVSDSRVRHALVNSQALTLGMDPLNVAIRNMQLAHAVAAVAKRAATHDMVEVHCLTDAFLVVVSLIERGLDALDESEARP
ncbi:MAG TPA: hypothetical protein VNR40_08460 [Steroidobacter sp.]|nr:hypothetical protein [Steroidobacter sp.]